MSVDPVFTQMNDRFDSLKRHRSQYEASWSAIRRLVRPNVPDFFSGKSDRNTRSIYDGTAPWALEQLASGLHSFNVSSSELWFSLSYSGPEEESDELLYWLSEAENLLYREYMRPESGFDSSLHEQFLELAGFGTSALYQGYSRKVNCLYFRAYPLADCWIDENSEGRVDVLFRRSLMTYRQIAQEFGEDADLVRIASASRGSPGRVFEVIHGVFPRTDVSLEDLRGIDTTKAFVSIHFCPEFSLILRKGGYDSFPYHVPRWTKLAGEVYGQSPAGNCLPDIQMVNQMVRTVLSAAQKASDPPLIVPNSGFLLPLRTSPGSISYKEPNTEDIKALPVNHGPELGLAMMDHHRTQITRSFYIEHLLRERKRERQTSLEIQDERMEMLQQLGPVFGRISSELLGPMIFRSLSLLQSEGRLEGPPVQEGAIEPHYTSQAARAQSMEKSMGIRRFLEGILPLASMEPSIVSSINFPELLRLSSRYENVPPSVMRSESEVAEIEERQRRVAEMSQLSEVAESSARTARHIAEAQGVI